MIRSLTILQHDLRRNDSRRTGTNSYNHPFLKRITHLHQLARDCVYLHLFYDVTVLRIDRTISSLSPVFYGPQYQKTVQ